MTLCCRWRSSGSRRAWSRPPARRCKQTQKVTGRSEVVKRVFLPCAARSQWSPPGLARHVSSCDVPKALAHQQLLPASRAPGVGEEDLHSCRAGEYGAVELGLILCGDGGMETHMDHKWGCRVQHTVELWVRQWERTFAILPKVGHSGSLCLTGHSHHLEDRPAARA